MDSLSVGSWEPNNFRVLYELRRRKLQDIQAPNKTHLEFQLVELLLAVVLS